MKVCYPTHHPFSAQFWDYAESFVKFGLNLNGILLFSLQFGLLDVLCYHGETLLNLSQIFHIKITYLTCDPYFVLFSVYVFQ